jgi:hypothetical protein
MVTSTAQPPEPDRSAAAPPQDERPDYSLAQLALYALRLAAQDRFAKPGEMMLFAPRFTFGQFSRPVE